LKTLGNSKVSPQFQITIPLAARKFLKARKGDLIVFVENRSNLLLKLGEVRIKR